MGTSTRDRGPKRASPPSGGGRRVGIAAALSVLVLAQLTFLPTIRFDLVWDDPMLLSQVGRVAETGGVKKLFASDFRLIVDRPLGYYRPVTTSSLWLQADGAWRSGGVDALPKAARSLHAANVLIHMVCSLLVWLLLRRVLPGHDWAAWLGSALFAVHPAHVEPVAFVSARTDLLAAMFVLGSILCWLEARRAAGARRLGALIAGPVFALAAALSKEHALLLPVVLIAWSFLLRVPGRTWWAENRGWLAPWLLAAVLALVLRAQVAHVGFGLGHVSIESFLRVGLPALLAYLRLWFVPWPLTPYYTSHDVAIGLASVAGLALTGALVVLATRSQRARDAAAALVFALLFLLPVLHVVPLDGAVAAERFFYLPSAGLALLTALALVSLERARVPRLASRAVAGVAAGVFMLVSVNAARPWASDMALFTHMVKASPTAAISHRGLAEVLMREEKYAEAAQLSREAIRLDPGYADAYELLGVASARLGDNATARESFDAVRRMRPQRASSYTNLGVLAATEGELEAALVLFQRAAELDPQSPDIHFYLGNVMAMTGDLAGARGEAAILDRLDPARAQVLRQALESPPSAGDEPPGGPQ